MIKIDQTDGDYINDLVPDLTPLLDILFILLVFFILTAGAAFQSLELTLPENVSEELELIQESKHIMLEIRPHGYAINGQTIGTLHVLKDEITKHVKNNPDHELIVAGDKNASIERLLNVLTYLQSQGIQAANILMQKDISK